MINAADAQAYQDRTLPHVSRTFALTIPQLPDDLQSPVANAYLLCRIADTLEDSAHLSPDVKNTLCLQFADAVADPRLAGAFASAAQRALAQHENAHETDLIAHTETVLALTATYPHAQRDEITRCLRIMCRGMGEFALKNTRRGLATRAELDHYCYYVAGVVGEMLADLFYHHCQPSMPYDRFRLLAVSFGQGLQMTNILKDIWDDQTRDACWLPRDVFAAHGFDLDRLADRHGHPGFIAGMEELIAIARGHLDNAMDYTLSIPRGETGIRRFCLWAIGMAVLTLGKINANRQFTNSTSVKISRDAVKRTILTTNALNFSNLALKTLFRVAARGLPEPPSPVPINRPEPAIESRP